MAITILNHKLVRIASKVMKKFLNGLDDYTVVPAHQHATENVYLTDLSDVFNPFILLTVPPTLGVPDVTIKFYHPYIGDIIELIYEIKNDVVVELESGYFEKGLTLDQFIKVLNEQYPAKNQRDISDLEEGRLYAKFEIPLAILNIHGEGV